MVRVEIKVNTWLPNNIIALENRKCLMAKCWWVFTKLKECVTQNKQWTFLFYFDWLYLFLPWCILLSNSFLILYYINKCRTDTLNKVNIFFTETCCFHLKFTCSPSLIIKIKSVSLSFTQNTYLPLASEGWREVMLSVCPPLQGGTPVRVQMGGGVYPSQVQV